MAYIKKQSRYFIIALLVVACSAEKETAEATEEKDTVTNYVLPEEKGIDPVGMDCGMAGYRDSGLVNYRGSQLKVTVFFVCSEQERTSDDPRENYLLNEHDKTNTLYLAMRSKNFDTSFIVYKKYFLDSLGADFLKESVFGTTSFEKLEGKEDFIFTSFIGAPQSDDGLLVRFAFNRKKGIRVLSSEYPDMGEGE